MSLDNKNEMAALGCVCGAVANVRIAEAEVNTRVATFVSTKEFDFNLNFQQLYFKARFTPFP